MKQKTVMALGGIFVACLACGPKPGAQTLNNSQANSSQNANSSAHPDFKALLFADQSIEEVAKMAKPAAAGANDPWSLFNSSLAASRQGNKDKAKNDLKQVLALTEVESRMQLWAWKGLRELGEKPPADIADQIQGIVCELHNEAGVGTIAAYVDRRARWHGGQGKVIVWEAPGNDANLDRLVRELLKSAEPLVKGAPLSDNRKTPEPALDHFRVSILTFGGIRTVEVFGPEIVEDQPVAAVLISSVKLLDALTQKSERSN